MARRALALLAGDPTPEAQVLAAVLKGDLKYPGEDDSVGVFTRNDLTADLGASLADLVERTWPERLPTSPSCSCS